MRQTLQGSIASDLSWPTNMKLPPTPIFVNQVFYIFVVVVFLGLAYYSQNILEYNSEGWWAIKFSLNFTWSWGLFPYIYCLAQKKRNAPLCGWESRPRLVDTYLWLPSKGLFSKARSPSFGWVEKSKTNKKLSETSLVEEEEAMCEEFSSTVHCRRY